ncbi:lipopolysaccharide assembly LapA domain-containing protein [Brachybacterium sp. FME24]|uniref:LapA family protein n=1 Tax=Brachybacterium sp. FME24 TaxID=2742605 RepID=UPI001D00BF62|nr:lipopolysaccharide assembly protein LapA domain-containing protein [Brachybacterium sp. FME24]
MSTGPENTDRPVDRAPETPRPVADERTPAPATRPRTSEPAAGRRAADPVDPVDETNGSPRSQEPGPGRRAADQPDAGSLAPTSSGGKTAGVWISLILGAIVLVLLLIFVIQNSETAGFEYFNATFDLPLGVAMLLAAIAGALVMALVGSVRMIQMSWTIRKMRKQQEKIQRAAR